MFPYVGDLLSALFGVHIPLPIHMFGFMVAIALLTASWVASLQLTRLVGPEGPARYLLKGDTFKGGKETPADLVATLTTLGGVFGIIGARVFHILEYPADFMRDPLGMIFSQGGFTFYGGVLFGMLAGAWYVCRKGIPLKVMLDVVAPALMIGYAIGRIGCQLAGDGDWGIAANLSLKPSWVPTWFWAQTFPHNVVGVTIPPPGVYPTSMYETLVCLVLFGILWAVRKHPFQFGWLFSLYLLLNGIERLLIELIRVNSRYTVFGFSFTQAEMIATILIVFGVVGLFLTGKRREATGEEPASSLEAPQALSR